MFTNWFYLCNNVHKAYLPKNVTFYGTDIDYYIFVKRNEFKNILSILKCT